MDRVTRAAFMDELVKLAENRLSKTAVSAKDVALIGVGGAGVYAGNKAYGDWRLGRAMRMQQRQQAMGY